MAIYKAKPSKQQLTWADMEMGVIIHHLMDVYNPAYTRIKDAGVREHMPASIFAPTDLDTDQWIKAARDMGAKYAVLVANHCTGFSLWPTKVNEYSVKNCPWKGGKGDVVADFIKSCEKYGLKPGLYYSTGCNGYYNINDDRKIDYRSDEYQAYVRAVEAQLTELWTEYGQLFEIWFDGGIVPREIGGPDAAGLLEKYQPDAICFQGPKEHRHDVRWVGNELGLAPENCWATTNNGEAAFDGTFDNEAAGVGDPDGKYWWPAETDMGNRDKGSFGGGWAWKAGEEDHVYSTDQLMECYCRSVGRNSNLLVGMAIAASGQFEDARQFEEFGRRVRETFAKPLASAQGRGERFVLRLDEPAPIHYIVVREDITDGQNIRGFRILLDGETLTESECVGHKRIVKAEGRLAREVVFEVTKQADVPTLRDITLY